MHKSICLDPITKHTRFRLLEDARAKRQPWSWPLSRLGNRNPIIIGDYTTDERQGVELGYAVAPFDSELFVPVQATQSGQLSFAMEGANGFSVSIDHGALTTHYAHMSKMFVPRTLPRAKASNSSAWTLRRAAARSTSAHRVRRSTAGRLRR